MSPNNHNSRRVRFSVLGVLLLALAILMFGAVFAPGPIHAQVADNDYVDVGLILEVPEAGTGTSLYRYLNIGVVNNGTRTAYDVEVVVDMVSPEQDSYVSLDGPRVPVGTAFRDGTSFRWTLPELGPLQRVEVVGFVRHSEHVQNAEWDNSEYPHEFFGEVTTSSFESELHKGNNTARVWSYNASTNYSYYPAGGNYTVIVSVDELSPSPGDTVKFTITASRAEKAHNVPSYTPPIDLRTDILLTDGLSVSAPPDYGCAVPDDCTVPDQVIYSNGEFNIGTLKRRDPVRHSLILPVRVASTAVVNEQCLTATLTGDPPPGTGRIDDDISDNVAKLCLGTAPDGPLLISQVDIFNIYPCVSNSDLPCDNSDDVRVRAVNKIGPSGVNLGPGKALLQVRDKPNREYDSSMYSVNAGAIVSWPISVKWTAEHFSTVIAQWSYLSDGFTASGASGGAPPGRVHVRAFEDIPIIYELTPDTSPPWTAEDAGYEPDATTIGPYEYTAEFEKLGTYKLQYTVKLTRAPLDGDENCDPNTANPPVNQRFCATETYIFHIGPIAELEVRDGGASPHIAADQHALTIVAINNGPDEPSVGTRVTGLPAGAEVLHISQGTYDDSTGQWNIGELKLRSRYQSLGEPDPTLVLGASAGDSASVSIASTKNYEVCVGPKDNPVDLPHTTQAACEHVTDASWNSTPVYDWKPDNNTATVTARAGTGGVGEGIPTVRAPEVHTPAIGYEWDEIDYLYSLPVKHYETEWSPDGVTGWTRFSEEIVGTKHVDTQVHTSGFRYYRVRAVNQAGVPGPWSAPMATSTGLVKADAPALTAQASSSTAIRLTWTRPTGLSSPVTGYELQVADDSSGPWSDVPDRLGPSALSYTYSTHALTGGTRKYFRIRALTGDDASDWSRVVQATTLPAGKPGAPRSVSAQAQGTDNVVLSWNAPGSDGGSPITRYEVEWRTGGGSWQHLGYTMDGYTYTLRHDLAEEFKGSADRYEGQTYSYRVRAHNSTGPGPWSGAASAITRTDVPDAPILSVKSKTSTETILAWEQYFPNPEASNVYRYELQYNLDGEEWKDSWRLLTTLGSSDREYRDTSMDVGETVWYRIRAVASNGNSSWSNVVKVTTPQGPPGPPGNVRAEAGDSKVIKVYWGLPYRTGGSRVWRYQIQASNAENPNTDYSPIATIRRFDDDRCNYVEDTEPVRQYCWYGHGGLDSGDTWHYRVRAENRSGWGPFSEWVSATVN